jgi:phosphoribosylamine--glycine ligase
MRVLFITDDFGGASLCARLHHEGHDVRAHVGNRAFTHTLDGWIPKISELDEGLDWVGPAGLVVCDDNGFGELADSLRARGFSVVGSSAGGDRLEDDREHAQKVFAAHGIQTIPTHTFDSGMEAAAFIEAHPAEWVIKRNGHADKTVCYVGRLPDGRDTINLLRNDAARDAHPVPYVLQKRISGIEIGVGRYFNGRDWVGPIELNIEHKKLFPGDIGPKTCEMGTLLWYTDDEENRLFREVLAPLRPYLQQVGFKGDVDINCMVNEEGAWPMEATTRFGYPAMQAQMALHETPWGEFLKAIADGTPYDLKWRSGYAVVILIALPPFPYCAGSKTGCAMTPCGLQIHFRQPPDPTDWPHLHFEDVRIEAPGTEQEWFVICGSTGYVMHVTGHGATVEEARQQACRRIENIVIPRMYYRADIGQSFIHATQSKLQQLGYL